MHSCSNRQPIEIETSQPVVTLKYLDKDALPQVTDFGNARTNWSFIIRSDIQFEEIPRLHTEGTYVFKIKDIHISLALDISMKLPVGVNDKLRRHEESHVEMTEAVYQDAPQIAQKCAQPMLEQKFIEHSTDADSAKALALREARMSLSTEYKQLTDEKANTLGRIFDKITHHGMNNVPDAEAKKQALEQYASSPIF